jgi:hypothetical protein
MHSFRGQLSLALDALGNSAAEVAATLKAERVQGVRHTARFLNPLVVFIEATLSLPPLSAEILENGTLRIRLADGALVEVPLSDPIKGFLEAFNRGAHPDLEIRDPHR